MEQRNEYGMRVKNAGESGIALSTKDCVTLSGVIVQASDSFEFLQKEIESLLLKLDPVLNPSLEPKASKDAAKSDLIPSYSTSIIRVKELDDSIRNLAYRVRAINERAAI